MGTEWPHRQPGKATFACEPCVFIGAVEGKLKMKYLGGLCDKTLLFCTHRPVVFKKEVEKAFSKQETDLPLFGNTFIWA